ncbi:MAG: hypothetical protein ACON5B_09170 [Myxococcota bacterium]
MIRTRFEYLVAFVSNDRVLRTNGNWQGHVDEGEPNAEESCPSLFEYLNTAGNQGWELVSIDDEDVGTAQLYFKRAFHL